MAERSKLKPKTKELRSNPKLPKRVNHSEAGSSIARALEEEDRLRFGNEGAGETQETKQPTVPKESIPNGTDSKQRDGTKKKEHRGTHKVHQPKKIESKGKEKEGIKPIARRCHSDSELDSHHTHTHKTRSKNHVRRRPSLRNKNGKEERGNLKSANRLLSEEREKSSTIPLKLPKDKCCEQSDALTASTSNWCIQTREKLEPSCTKNLASNTKDDLDQLGKCEEKNCSHETLLNLLLVYFKELTKEVCEFREEKKQMREQIYKLEMNVEKLVFKCDAQELKIKSLFTQESKIVGRGIDTTSEHDLRKEIRAILEEIHQKYHRQLIEHETRIKSVQEKAEYEVQNLMRNIVDNYVELRELKGKENDVDGIIRKHKTKFEMPINPNNFENETTHIVSSISKNDLTSFKAASKRVQIEGTEQPTNHLCKPRKKYEFYFPRSDEIKKTLSPKATQSSLAASKENTDSKVSSIAETQLSFLATIDQRDNWKLQGTNQSTIRNASAYFQWKQFWRDKLTQRANLAILDIEKPQIRHEYTSGNKTAENRNPT